MKTILASLAVLIAYSAILGAVATSAEADERPKVRDHRKPILCFGGLFGGTTCYRTPWKPR